MGGRTPLFLACKTNNIQSVKALLAGKANPGIRTYGGISPLQVTDNDKLKGFLAKALLMHICMPLIPVKRRKYVWENEGLIYFESPDHMYIVDFS